MGDDNSPTLTLRSIQDKFNFEIGAYDGYEQK